MNEEYPDFVESTGYGVDKLGLCGINCYHTFFAFIPGVSERNYTDEQLAVMNAKENEKRQFRGKEYTTYEASQKQRALERLMRKQRQEISLLKKGEAAKEDISAARSRYRQAMKEYSEFSKSMELPEQRARIYIDGLGRV